MLKEPTSPTLLPCAAYRTWPGFVTAVSSSQENIFLSLSFSPRRTLYLLSWALAMPRGQPGCRSSSTLLSSALLANSHPDLNSASSAHLIITLWDKQGTTWDLIVSRFNSSRTIGRRKDGKQAEGCIFSFLSAYKGLCVCWGGDGRGEGERGAGTVKFEGEKSLYIWISGVLGPSKIVKIPFFE